MHFNTDLGLLLRHCRGQGPHLGMTGESRGFSQGAAGWPGKPNLPFELRGKAGGCARVTAGPKRPHLGVSCIGEEMATHSSVLAWRIPGIAEPGGLPSMGWHRVGHD